MHFNTNQQVIIVFLQNNSINTQRLKIYRLNIYLTDTL